MVVYEKSLENKEYEGMGTTLEVCLIYNSRAYILHTLVIVEFLEYVND